MISNVKKVKLALLILTSTILVLVAIAITTYQYRAILQEQSEGFTLVHKKTHMLYTNILEHLKKEMTSYAKISLQSDKTAYSLYKQDRQTLEEINAPLFKIFQEHNPYLKIMTFRLKNGETLLRLHKPDIFGDSLHPSRKSILNVNKEHSTQATFEVGKLEMAYRVILPVFYNQIYVGSLELGVDHAYILQKLKQVFPLQYALIVKTSKTSAALKLKTLAKIEDFYLLRADPIFIDNYEKIVLSLDADTDTDAERIILNHKEHLFSLSPSLNIFDSSGDILAKILIAQDINKTVIKTDQLIYRTFIFTLVVVLILGSLLHLGFNYFIKKIEHSQKQLETFNESLEEKVLQQTKEQSLLLSLFDKRDSVLFKWNNDKYWSISNVSQSVQRVMGYDTNDFLSQRVDYASCIHPDDLAKVRQEVAQALESQLDFFTHKPYRILTKEGDVKWIHDNTTLVKNTQGEVTHFIGVISDISEVKQKDKQLMDQSRLVQMGELISMIAHQWRQPLAAITATTIALKIKMDLKKYKLEKEDERELCQTDFKRELERIEDLTQTLTSTITDFRNFYQPQKDYKTMSIHEPLSKALNIIKSSLINNKITLVQELAGTLELELLGNEIMQVVLNIFKNSQDNFQIKDIKKRKMWVSSYDIEGGIELNICDNGGGIDEDILDKIFDPYFSTKYDKNGTGLGLYMSKTIIEEHHRGKLSVINKNDGVCFYISLYKKRTIV